MKGLQQLEKSDRESVSLNNICLLEAVSDIKEITAMQQRDLFEDKFDKARDKERHARLIEKILNLAQNN